MSKRRNTESDFWKNVDMRGEDECWEWKGSKTGPKGYGEISMGRKLWRTHRLSYFLTHGEIPEGKMICHSCDNPPCCNPKHLFAGTALDNALDMHSKGRANPPRGDAHHVRKNPSLAPRMYGASNGMNLHPEKVLQGESVGGAKLKNAQVLEIKERIESGEKGTDLARIFQVSTSLISRIRRGNRRKKA